MPPPLPRGGLGIPQSFASSPEAPLPGELSAKQTERLDKGQPDREALAKLNLSVTADAVPLPGLRLPASASLSLASCWPRPQQLLPVSAAGGGRRRCSYRGEALAFCKALPTRQRLPYQGSCLRSRLRGWTKDSLAGKLLLGSTSPSSLTRCHLPYRGEALAFRKALPPRQRLPYQGSCLRSRLRGWTKDSLTASH